MIVNKYSQNTKELPIDPAITESIEQDIAQQPEVQAALRAFFLRPAEKFCGIYRLFSIFCIE